jgi:radical SAM protein with 4Fe4S-binding SPASM domain
LTFKTVNIKYGPGPVGEKIEKFLPRNANFSRYLPRSARRKVYLKNKCYRLWFSTVINWDGEVVPCCYDADGSFSFGNIGEHGFKKIWNNSKYRQFRGKVLRDKKGINLCQDCPGTLLGLTLSL